MAVHDGLVLDALDFALLDAMHEHPRAGVLELSRHMLDVEHVPADEKVH